MTASELIEALKRLPPDTEVRAEGGWIEISLDEDTPIHTAPNGTKWVNVG